jgi:hypothetical protein
MNTGAAHLTHCVEVWDAGTPYKVHLHTSAEVMRGWYDRDRLAGDIYISLQAIGIDLREALT